MAEPTKLLFDNVAWREWDGVSLSTNVSLANELGGRHWLAADGRLNTRWIVDSSHGTAVRLVIDRGGTQVAETDYPLGIGIFNHNFGLTQVETLAVDRSSNGADWTTLFSIDLATDPVSTDYIYQSSVNLTDHRYYRVDIDFGGGWPTPVALEIGQLYVGRIITLTDDEAPTIPLSSPYTFPATIERGGGGGRVVQARGVREQLFDLGFRSKDAAFLTKFQDFLHRQDMAVHPFGIHTHRHTADAWDTSPAGASVDARGGAYFAQVDRDTTGWVEVFEGTHDLELGLVRHMLPTAV